MLTGFMRLFVGSNQEAPFFQSESDCYPPNCIHVYFFPLLPDSELQTTAYERTLLNYIRTSSESVGLFQGFERRSISRPDLSDMRSTAAKSTAMPHSYNLCMANGEVTQL